jgi:hypothetical protein
MAASNTRFTQNSLGQSKNLIDSDHGIYRDPLHFELRFLGGNRESAGLEDEWIGRRIFISAMR